jgi:hypothetical protein
MSIEAIVQAAGATVACGAAIVGVSTHLAITLAALVLVGAGWVLTLATFNVAVQMSAPRWVVARALSLYQMAAFGGLAGRQLVVGCRGRGRRASKSQCSWRPP